jgi:trans-2,3-dihydro-3-hydroxyanthranilate isomerase
MSSKTPADRTREVPFVLVDVFTTTPLEGNALAVFPDADAIGEGEMQRIAAEMNLSETAFILQPTMPNAVARLRIFTPRRELDFAGHPTIGSAYVLSDAGPRFVLEENIGYVPIQAEGSDGDRLFWLTTPPLTFFETLELSFCANLLGVSDDDLVESCPPQFVSAGSPLLFICLKSAEAVDRAEIRQAHLPQALGRANSVGTFIFARKAPKSNDCFDVYSRMFAPQIGISEDPATGGAMGPLAGYMLKYGQLSKTAVRFTSEQGVKMGRRSILHVRLETRDGADEIDVGGHVVSVARGKFYIS